MDLKTRLEWMLHDAESNLTKNPVKKALHRVKMKELEIMTEKRMNFRLDKSLHTAFKTKAVKLEVPMNEVLTALIQGYVDGKFQITPEKPENLTNSGEGE